MAKTQFLKALKDLTMTTFIDNDNFHLSLYRLGPSDEMSSPMVKFLGRVMFDETPCMYNVYRLYG